VDVLSLRPRQRARPPADHPLELYDAARVDGASTVRQFVHITLPQLRNVLLIVLLLRGIWMFTKSTCRGSSGSAEARGGHPHAARLHLSALVHLLPGGDGAALSNVMLALLLMAVTIYFVAFPPEADETDG